MGSPLFIVYYVSSTVMQVSYTTHFSKSSILRIAGRSYTKEAYYDL